MRPVKILGGGDFSTELAGVHHVEVLPVRALDVELDRLGPAEDFTTNIAGVVGAHVV